MTQAQTQEPTKAKSAGKKTTLKLTKLSDIKVPERYRKDFGDITGLAQSIKDTGLIQPITVNADTLELVAGERRYKACISLGMTEIPALHRHITGELNYRIVELEENKHRKDFSWAEECLLVEEIDRIKKEEAAARGETWTIRDTAAETEGSKTQVHKQLEMARALKAVPELKDCPTFSDASRKLNKILETAAVAQLAERVKTDDSNKDLQEFLARANANYKVVDDALAAMEELPELVSSISFIQCDPPYGIDLNDVKNQEGSRPETYREIPRDKYPDFLKRLCSILYRKAAQHCWMTFWYGPTHHQLVLTSLREAGWEVDEIPALWIKPTGQTLQPNVYLGRAYEPFFICRKGKPAILKPGTRNVFDFKPVPASKKYHPTQKPLALMSAIITTFAAPRQTMLVPFLGSGVDLRAGYLNGMPCFGFDCNGEYKDAFLLSVADDLNALNSDDQDEGD